MSSSATPIYGNYQGYYQKRPSICDPRLSLLPPKLLLGKVVLDVGCNEGLVTCEVGQQWSAKKVVGVDIDESLIRNAWKRRRTMWSVQKPRTDKEDDIATDESFATKFEEAHYFPASLVHSFGPVPFAPTSESSAETFPHNVLFRTADWVNVEIVEDKEGYDVILGFSISKWIHLNEGDEGVRRFFRRAFDCLRSGGCFILEAQPWDGYAKAKRMDERLRSNYQTLELRPDGFGAVLESIGFEPGERLGKTGDGGFRRPIDMYRKP